MERLIHPIQLTLTTNTVLHKFPQHIPLYPSILESKTEIVAGTKPVCGTFFFRGRVICVLTSYVILCLRRKKKKKVSSIIEEEFLQLKDSSLPHYRRKCEPTLRHKGKEASRVLWVHSTKVNVYEAVGVGLFGVDGPPYTTSRYTILLAIEGQQKETQGGPPMSMELTITTQGS